MNSLVLLTVFFAAINAASIGLDERRALLLKTGADCARKAGISSSSLAQHDQSDPAYNEFLSCFFGKYYDEKKIDTTAKEVVQNFSVIVSYSRECSAESKIKASSLLKIADENPPDDDPGYKKYIVCYLLKAGILTDDGEIAEDTTQIQTWVSADMAQIILAEAKNICGGKKEETLEDTAVNIFRCFMRIRTPT